MPSAVKHLASAPLVIEAFRWARALSPVHPLGSCIYTYEEDWLGMNTVIAQLSDIINLRSYVSLVYKREPFRNRYA